MTHQAHNDSNQISSKQNTQSNPLKEQRAVSPEYRGLMCCNRFEEVMHELGFVQAKWSWNLSDSGWAAMRPNFADLIVSHFGTNPSICGVDLGAGADGERWFAQEVQSALGHLGAVVSIDETDVSSNVLKSNQAYLAESGAHSRDFVSANSPYPFNNQQILSHARELLHENGLLYFSPDCIRGVATTIACLLATGFKVSFVRGFEDQPRLSGWGNPIGVVLATTVHSDMHEYLSSLKLQSLELSLEGRLMLFTSSIAVHTWGVPTFRLNDVRNVDIDSNIK